MNELQLLLLKLNQKYHKDVDHGVMTIGAFKEIIREIINEQNRRNENERKSNDEVDDL